MKWGRRSESEDKKAVNFRYREDFSGGEFNIFYIFLSKFGFFFLKQWRFFSFNFQMEMRRL